MINVLDKTYQPNIDDFIEYAQGTNKIRWLDINDYLSNKEKTNHSIMYSSCSAKPGWNLKYKRNSKALCTLYPGKDSFTCLLVLNRELMNMIDGNEIELSPYIMNLYEKAMPFNNTKWLMIEVDNNKILNELKKLIDIKIYH